MGDEEAVVAGFGGPDARCLGVLGALWRLVLIALLQLVGNVRRVGGWRVRAEDGQLLLDCFLDQGVGESDEGASGDVPGVVEVGFPQQ